MQTAQLSANIHLQRPADNINSSRLLWDDPQWISDSQSGPLSLHQEIRSVVQLVDIHARKVYFSGPLIRRVERQPNGQRPGEDEGWTAVWAQLTGTTLSIWDTKGVQAVGGEGVPPSYANVTNILLQVFGAVPMPATSSSPTKLYTNVLSLNTAGSNLLLFSCPSAESLISWVAAMRLSTWEKSRLDEIYTAHLIRISNIAYDTPTTLIHGQMKGWVQIRVAGQNSWVRVWMVVRSCGDSTAQFAKLGDSIGPGSTHIATRRGKRISDIFSQETNSMQLPTKPIIELYLSDKSKDMKKVLLTMTDVTQAFSVYPERPHLVGESALIKLEGTLGDEELAGSMRSREAWILLTPKFEGKTEQTPEMLKWVTSFHDAFGLYGRPKAWTWDPRNIKSLMFAYPVGPLKDLLFLDRKIVEVLNPRDDRTAAIRSRLLSILLTRIYGNEGRPSAQAALNRSGSLTSSQSPDALAPQLPPLDFDFGWAIDLPDSTSLMSITAVFHLEQSPPSRLTERTEPATPLTPQISNTAKADPDTLKEMEEHLGYGPLLYLLKIYRET